MCIRDSYSAIRIGEATGFNPFQTETDERGAAWLTDWLGDILAGSRPFETAQTVSLNAAVRQIVLADPRLRTFDGLATLVASTDDEGDLVGRVREWGQGGRHGWLFGPGASSEISLSEDVVGIDMSEILDLGTERSALLAYLFRRIERVIEDRRPTLIVIDEAWKMLDDPIFEKRLLDWLVTMRKKNAVVMMLTQTPTHLTRVKVGPDELLVAAKIEVAATGNVPISVALRGKGPGHREAEPATTTTPTPPATTPAATPSVPATAPVDPPAAKPKKDPFLPTKPPSGDGDVFLPVNKGA